jgi:hypothetical protein
MSEASPQIETRLFKAFWDDGLLDIFCGVALLAVGIGWGLHQVLLASVVPPILVPLWGPFRRKLVEPRAGYVEFSQARKEKTRTGLKVTFALCVGAFLLGVGMFLYLRVASIEEGYWVAGFIPGLPAMLLGVGALIAVQLTGARRFVVYALLMVSFGAATIALQFGPAMPMLASGMALTLSGAVLMVRFLRASAEFEEDA